MAGERVRTEEFGGRGLKEVEALIKGVRSRDSSIAYICVTVISFFVRVPAVSMGVIPGSQM